ncbi:YnbE family lipoprotein [Sphingobium sp. DEHP117]|uniref:YnbE family lipoprotein n=1 Tax=Sphingobium sp. DEHP117 TaxID=2993436 RepID=UPI0027D956CD|nr:YnbE family lipoprotein [Sphingobium sp. DEHP117]
MIVVLGEGDAGLRAGKAFGIGVACLLLGGCITVKAPDRPIEINLNVKVQQEVIVRLQKDAQDLIQNNPELFPQ